MVDAQGISDALQSIVQKRAKPLAVLLDGTGRIAYADPDALDLICDIFRAQPPLERLPELLDLAVSKTVANARSRNELFICPIPELCCRINWLTGRDGTFTVVYLEQHRSRESMGWATNTFGFTRREREVLHLVLCGLNGTEIARALSISEQTVADHVKNLARKTNAKNRADMVAKVLGWTSASSATAGAEAAVL